MKATLIFTLVFAIQTVLILGEVSDGTTSPTTSITLESTKLTSKEPLQSVTDQTDYVSNPASITKPTVSTEQVIPSPETSEESESSESDGIQESSDESTVRYKRQNFASILGFQEDEPTASPEDQDEEEDEDDEDEDDDYDLGLSDLLDFSGFPIISSFLSK